MSKTRIDLLLVRSGLVNSRSKAQRLVMAGEVEVNGQMVHKPSEAFDPACEISIRNKPRYVSRGGLKLEKAIDHFTQISVAGKTCVDVGASTGGFTDCLLKNGASRVYAVDVGYGQLHQKMRNHPSVVVMERVNVRELDNLPEAIDLVTIDVSFISLKMVLPVVKKWTINREMDIIALIKPQFEVGRKIAAKGKGIIHSEKDRMVVVDQIVSFSKEERFEVRGVIESPIKGPKGNVEYLIYLKRYRLPIE